MRHDCLQSSATCDPAPPRRLEYMTNTKGLADAVESLAKTITDAIEVKVREYAAAAHASGTVPAGIVKPSWTEGWVGKKEVAEHLGISQRTLYNWMERRLIPYMRIGRSVRFKLSEVDEAINRQIRIESRY